MSAFFSPIVHFALLLLSFKDKFELYQSLSSRKNFLATLNFRGGTPVNLCLHNESFFPQEEKNIVPRYSKDELPNILSAL